MRWKEELALRAAKMPEKKTPWYRREFSLGEDKEDIIVVLLTIAVVKILYFAPYLGWI